MKQYDVGELLADEPELTVISSVNDDEKSVDSEESDSDKSVVEFSSKLFGDILKKFLVWIQILNHTEYSTQFD